MAKHTTLILKLNKSEIDTERQKLINQHTGCKYSDNAVEIPQQSGDPKLIVFQKVDLNILPKIPEGGYDVIVLDEVIEKVDKVLEILYSRMPEDEAIALRKKIADAKNPPTETPPEPDQTPENPEQTEQNPSESSENEEKGNDTPPEGQSS